MKEGLCIIFCWQSAVLRMMAISGLLIMSLNSTFAQTSLNNQANDDDKLIEQLIQARGLSNSIVFDAKNIKQYWVNNSVSSKNDLIHIVLNEDSQKSWKSEQMRIQLANVFETLDCKIDVITNDSNLSFIVSNNKSETISKSFEGEDFIQYHIVSSTFHLEDTQDFSFYLSFFSEWTDVLNIKKIILSFSNNSASHYLGSPGFEALSKQIEKDGIPVPNSDVKYIISKEHNKIYIMIPKDLAETYRFSYHIYPTDENNLLPDRKEYKYNNHDFKLSTPYLLIPPPKKSNYVILQRDLPSYQYSLLRIGQYEPGKSIWRIELK